MSFEQVEDIGEAAILESKLLLFVSPIDDGAKEIIGLLPLDDVV